jgi:hypothetical protein
MDWQQIVSLLIVGGAFGGIVRSEVRKRARRTQRLCGGDCQCSALKSAALHGTKK